MFSLLTAWCHAWWCSATVSCSSLSAAVACGPQVAGSRNARRSTAASRRLADATHCGVGQMYAPLPGRRVSGSVQTVVAVRTSRISALLSRMARHPTQVRSGTRGVSPCKGTSFHCCCFGTAFTRSVYASVSATGVVSSPSASESSSAAWRAASADSYAASMAFAPSSESGLPNSSIKPASNAS